MDPGSVCDAILALGDFRIDALCDADGRFPVRLEEAFPRGPAGGWEPVARRYPRSFDATATWWLLHCRCFLIRSASGVVLFDAGVGQDDAPGARWLGAGGSLVRKLRALGVRTGDVDMVVVSHVHLDHVGWLTQRRDGGELEPTFARATHFLPELDLAPPHGADHAWSIAPLLGTADVQAITGDREIAPGMRIVATPGHTPGSQSLAIDVAAGSAILWGDAANHPVQVTEPEVCSVGDADPAVAARTRARLAEEAARRGSIVGSSHFPHAFSHVVTENGQRYLAPVPAGPDSHSPQTSS